MMRYERERVGKDKERGKGVGWGVYYHKRKREGCLNELRLYKQGDSSGKEQHSLVKTACVNLKDLRLYTASRRMLRKR